VAAVVVCGQFGAHRLIECRMHCADCAVSYATRDSGRTRPHNRRYPFSTEAHDEIALICDSRRFHIGGSLWRSSPSPLDGMRLDRSVSVIVGPSPNASVTRWDCGRPTFAA
jgi:hypothetical protein